MKRTIIALSLLFVVGLSIGCNKGKDEVLPDGTKMFGKRTLKDGTQTAERKEFPDGRKNFNQTWLKDGTVKAERGELPDGGKNFNETWLKDGTVKAERIEFVGGKKSFDVTWLPDGTLKTGHDEFPDGEKSFDVTRLPDKTVVGRDELANGQKLFDLTILPDGTQESGRVEYPNGEKQFDTTKLPDGTVKIGRDELSDGKKQFDVVRLKDGSGTIGRVEVPSGESYSDIHLSANGKMTIPGPFGFWAGMKESDLTEKCDHNNFIVRDDKYSCILEHPIEPNSYFDDEALVTWSPNTGGLVELRIRGPKFSNPAGGEEKLLEIAESITAKYQARSVRLPGRDIRLGWRLPSTNKEHILSISLDLTVFDDPRVQGQGYISLDYQLFGYPDYAFYLAQREGKQRATDTQKF